jgi:methylenetetrahydrofolate/methylenetetrahydromethanopterin dehydrogenase (NADP+)
VWFAWYDRENMKRLLFLLDTDQVPSVFDTVVGYDGGADHVIGYSGVTPGNVGALIDGTIFTRPPREKHYTAIFVGGGNMAAGEELLGAITKRFFANFRVSVMLDSNGSNTTAAAAVALLAKARDLAGKKAVVLGGTGPVGMRAAALLAKEGASVSLTSRIKQRADAACRAIASRFGVSPTPVEAADNEARRRTIKGAQIVFAAGSIGAELLSAPHWQGEAEIELIADCNAQPPLGVAGIEATDKAKERSGKLVFGALGIGALKLKLHRACIGQLFERSDQVLDAEQIYALAKAMA